MATARTMAVSDAEVVPPEEELLQGESRDEILRAIDELPGSQRAVTHDLESELPADDAVRFEAHIGSATGASATSSRCV